MRDPLPHHKADTSGNPQLGPVYLGKVDLTDTYMRLWVGLEDITSASFLVPRKKPTYKQLVGLHLDLPMVYVDITSFLYMSTETIADMEN